MANLTLFNVTICLVVALGSFGYGFGFGAFITVIGEPGFYVYFQLDRESVGVSPSLQLTIYIATSDYTARHVLRSLHSPNPSDF